MTMIVQIQIRSVYGEDKAYPMNAAADGLALIAGTKTLTQRVIRTALAMGMTVQEIDRHGRVSRSYTVETENLPMVA